MAGLRVEILRKKLGVNQRIFMYIYYRIYVREFYAKSRDYCVQSESSDYQFFSLSLG